MSVTPPPKRRQEETLHIWRTLQLLQLCKGGGEGQIGLGEHKDKNNRHIINANISINLKMQNQN